MAQKAALGLGPKEPYQFVTLPPSTEASSHSDVNTQHFLCLTASEQPTRTGLSVFEQLFLAAPGTLLRNITFPVLSETSFFL